MSNSQLVAMFIEIGVLLILLIIVFLNYRFDWLGKIYADKIWIANIRIINGDHEIVVSGWRERTTPDADIYYYKYDGRFKYTIVPNDTALYPVIYIKRARKILVDPSKIIALPLVKPGSNKTIDSFSEIELNRSMLIWTCVEIVNSLKNQGKFNWKMILIVIGFLIVAVVGVWYVQTHMKKAPAASTTSTTTTTITGQPSTLTPLPGGAEK